MSSSNAIVVLIECVNCVMAIVLQSIVASTVSDTFRKQADYNVGRVHHSLHVHIIALFLSAILTRRVAMSDCPLWLDLFALDRPW